MNNKLYEQILKDSIDTIKQQIDFFENNEELVIVFNNQIVLNKGLLHKHLSDSIIPFLNNTVKELENEIIKLKNFKNENIKT